jgi:histidinol dehydrogenase
MPRKEIIEKSLNKFGLIIKVDTLKQACNLSNRIAPEHLELSVDNPTDLVEKIINAGSIFLGKFSSESLGDYCAGPNHVLPTSGSARFSSGLSVYDFLKRTSVISISEVGAKSLGKIASVMARGETLIAHAKSAEFRTRGSN